MRLIDADALHEEMCEFMNRFHALGKDRVAQDYNFVATVVGNAPTVDAVPVVRCRECRYFFHDVDDGVVCAETEAMLWPNEYDYCSRGQRRDQSADVRNMGQFAGGGKTEAEP